MTFVNDRLALGLLIAAALIAVGSLARHAVAKRTRRGGRMSDALNASVAEQLAAWLATVAGAPLPARGRGGRAAARRRRRRTVRGGAPRGLHRRHAGRRRPRRPVHGHRPRRRLRCVRRGARERHRGPRRRFRRHLRGRARACRRGCGARCAGGVRARRPVGPARGGGHRRGSRADVPPEPRGADGRAQGGLSSHGGLRRAGSGWRCRRHPWLAAGGAGVGAGDRRQHGVGHHRVPGRRHVDQAHACRLGGAIRPARGVDGPRGIQGPANRARRHARLLQGVRAVDRP